ncbi:hypothetical protein CDAR_383171 [Caerostris darwini]|uniref:Uncharacterized protein n=1 Tax=Caerostris darwini TaxID=1538125 RepID=A0AAV4NVL9_9ARAC|nr:hypothetical protein CDAR_383171 [Caerostris darwini]
MSLGYRVSRGPRAERHARAERHHRGSAEMGFGDWRWHQCQRGLLLAGNWFAPRIRKRFSFILGPGCFPLKMALMQGGGRGQPQAISISEAPLSMSLSVRHLSNPVSTHLRKNIPSDIASSFDHSPNDERKTVMKHVTLPFHG